MASYQLFLTSNWCQENNSRKWIVISASKTTKIFSIANINSERVRKQSNINDAKKHFVHAHVEDHLEKKREVFHWTPKNARNARNGWFEIISTNTFNNFCGYCKTSTSVTVTQWDIVYVTYKWTIFKSQANIWNTTWIYESMQMNSIVVANMWTLNSLK